MNAFFDFTSPSCYIDNEELNCTIGQANDFVSEPLVSYARQMRKNQTPAEALLWQLVRNRKLNGYKFRRQHPVYPYFIVDFFCMNTKLAVEIDGAYHLTESQKAYDIHRTQLLNHLGIHVIRFTNDEVIHNTDYVLRQILNACIKLNRGSSMEM